MVCRKCPHHVRHGQLAADGKTITFKDRCGLKMKEKSDHSCAHYPFNARFDYMVCEVYISTFKSVGRPNDAVPTSDFQYSDKIAGSSITEMELL
jgi:hypothetical protein